MQKWMNRGKVREEYFEFVFSYNLTEDFRMVTKCEVRNQCRRHFDFHSKDALLLFGP